MYDPYTQQFLLSILIVIVGVAIGVYIMTRYEKKRELIRRARNLDLQKVTCYLAHEAMTLQTDGKWCPETFEKQYNKQMYRVKKIADILGRRSYWDYHSLNHKPTMRKHENLGRVPVQMADRKGYYTC